jgi:hypothetical protein
MATTQRRYLHRITRCALAHARIPIGSARTVDASFDDAELGRVRTTRPAYVNADLFRSTDVNLHGITSARAVG